MLAARAQAGLNAGVLGARAAATRLPVDLGREVDDVADWVEGRAYQTETIIAGIIVGAALMIGFFVIDSIYDSASVASTVTDVPNSSVAQLSTDQNSTLDRIGDGLLIGGVLIIVLFAAIILRVLRGL